MRLSLTRVAQQNGSFHHLEIQFQYFHSQLIIFPKEFLKNSPFLPNVPYFSLYSEGLNVTYTNTPGEGICFITTIRSLFSFLFYFSKGRYSLGCLSYQSCYSFIQLLSLAPLCTAGLNKMEMLTRMPLGAQSRAVRHFFWMICLVFFIAVHFYCLQAIVFCC